MPLSPGRAVPWWPRAPTGCRYCGAGLEVERGGIGLHDRSIIPIEIDLAGKVKERLVLDVDSLFGRQHHPVPRLKHHVALGIRQVDSLRVDLVGGAGGDRVGPVAFIDATVIRVHHHATLRIAPRALAIGDPRPVGVARDFRIQRHRRQQDERDHR
jgi:hypothetical protein